MLLAKTMILIKRVLIRPYFTITGHNADLWLRIRNQTLMHVFIITPGWILHDTLKALKHELFILPCLLEQLYHPSLFLLKTRNAPLSLLELQIEIHLLVSLLLAWCSKQLLPSNPLNSFLLLLLDLHGGHLIILHIVIIYKLLGMRVNALHDIPLLSIHFTLLIFALLRSPDRQLLLGPEILRLLIFHLQFILP